MPLSVQSPLSPNALLAAAQDQRVGPPMWDALEDLLQAATRHYKAAG